MSQVLVVWDWNGTLVDDRGTAVAALNATLQYYGCPPIDDQFYADHFGFPVRPFYELCGLDFERIDWAELCHVFHRFVYQQPRAQLRADAVAALEYVQAHGGTNVILSALREDLLKRDVKAYGLERYFQQVFGVDNLDGASKVARGVAMMQALAPLPPKCWMIGDTLHDAQVAAELNLQCVLAQGGHQSRERLVASGNPVATNLLQAVERIYL